MRASKSIRRSQHRPDSTPAGNPTNEQAYSLYKKYVKVGYDPTEGVIRMEVSAADPEVSARFSEALISYAEQRVDDLSQRKREDQMGDARIGLEKGPQRTPRGPGQTCRAFRKDP